MQITLAAHKVVEEIGPFVEYFTHANSVTVLGFQVHIGKKRGEERGVNSSVP